MNPLPKLPDAVGLGWGGGDDAVEPLDIPESLECVRGRASFLDPGVDGDAGTEGGVLDRLEKRHGDGDLARERRLQRVLERDEQEIGGHEHGALCASDADRGVEHGRVEAAAREGHENAPGVSRRSQPPRRSAAVGESDGKRDDEGAENDDECGHDGLSGRSARLATTRMSIPGSSRTMRESSEPRRISTRRRSSGVPTKM